MSLFIGNLYRSAAHPCLDDPAATAGNEPGNGPTGSTGSTGASTTTSTTSAGASGPGYTTDPTTGATTSTTTGTGGGTTGTGGGTTGTGGGTTAPPAPTVVDTYSSGGVTTTVWSDGTKTTSGTAVAKPVDGTPTGANDNPAGGAVTVSATPGAPPPSDPYNLHQFPTNLGASSTNSTAPDIRSATGAPTVPTLSGLSSDALSSAGNVALAAQGGAVNSAESAGRAAGLSPTQAALLGAQAGSTTYQSSLGSAYSSGLSAGTNLANTAANQYGTAASENVGLGNTAASQYGTAASENVGLTTTKNQYDVGMAETQAQIQAAQYAGAGAAASGASALLGPIITGLAALAKGSDSTEAGPTLVGEHGPEIVQMPQGAKVIPNIKDGYDMLDYISRNVQSKNPNPPPQMDPTNQEVSNTAMIQALNDKLETVASYIKKGK